ncbi:MAG: DUF3999 family protein [Thermoguttaceae bacterium]|jgi:hypothetical protein
MTRFRRDWTFAKLWELLTKSRSRIGVLHNSNWKILVGLTMAAAISAQAAGAAPLEAGDSLASWQWVFEARLPTAAPQAPPWIDFLLPSAVFDNAQSDLRDLRLYDGRGREIPFAWRVRSTRNEEQPLGAKSFNRQENPDRSVQISLDLGLRPVEHQEIDVISKGSDVHRRVEVQGSDDGQSWGMLLDRAWIANYTVDGKKIDIHRLRYAPSRFRYLQVRVYTDLSQPDDKPDIAALTVYHTAQVPGEYVTRPAELSPREAVRAYGVPGSAWVVDLGGRNVPVEKLAFDVGTGEFSRSYVLEKIEDAGNYAVLARGDWRREPQDRGKPLEIQLSGDVAAHRLRLVVQDHANSPLDLFRAQYTAAARQVVFARRDLVAPVRLYTGNPRAEAPHYDFAATLPPVLQPAAVRVDLGPCEPNPIYRPEPKPWTERWPWLVYVVLGTASTVLLILLLLLARKALAARKVDPSPNGRSI